MLALSLSFPAGRYHATPWDRHVNEGAVAWPPEPWRLVRALIATWHHKVKHSAVHDEASLTALVEALSSESPHYVVPTATHSHTRHYMPQAKRGDTTLVFDAFVAVDRKDRVIVTWPTLDLPAAAQALLDDLLEQIGYLGRAESWVEAARVTGPVEANCVPGDEAVDRRTGEVLGEIVELLAPLTSRDYGAFREQFAASTGAIGKKLASTLPVKFLDALSVSTNDLHKAGWSRPPAARRLKYLLPVDAMRPVRRPQRDHVPEATTVRYLLVGKPLPRVEDTVRVAELLRRAVMSQAKHEFGEDSIPPKLSGHGLVRGSGHQHAFFLPWDSDGDGYLDRLILHVPVGLTQDEQRPLTKVRRLRDRDGREWSLVFEDAGNAGIGGPLLSMHQEWRSITPYLHPWHVKKTLSIEDQIRRECRERGLPAPSVVEAFGSIVVGSRDRRPTDFRRTRSKRGLVQADSRGGFWRLQFTQPVPGPLALGFGCHFGLGLFESVDPR